MSQTLHDVVKSALIKEALKDDSLPEAIKSLMTPKKYQRMWKKITGKDITIEQAKAALAKAGKVNQGNQ